MGSICVIECTVQWRLFLLPRMLCSITRTCTETFYHNYHSNDASASASLQVYKNSNSVRVCTSYTTVQI